MCMYQDGILVYYDSWYTMIASHIIVTISYFTILLLPTCSTNTPDLPGISNFIYVAPVRKKGDVNKASSADTLSIGEYTIN